ncbi:Glycine cleavage system H protein [Lacunisphaera limnophila]|uniref:Glycine cleavage system H protein n=1 Tax=Lacunisphaera limnophila TaxID=1838286 RepID=A0A1D8AXI2_9BACT|nr:glycine cleavage system protein GcvH [Lacunisphaera limnophila]AOS45580.1 Glycine cleavage system H protein [Lacunisphaera limnophila]
MSNLPSDLKYAKSHEWLKLSADGTALVGITDYAQNSLGDITFVQLPKVGTALKAGETFGVVESVKAASDVYAPVAGTVLEVNQALEANPEQVNSAPYAGGWMLKLKLIDPAAAESLLNAADYAKVIG